MAQYSKFECKGAEYAISNSKVKRRQRGRHRNKLSVLFASVLHLSLSGPIFQQVGDRLLAEKSFDGVHFFANTRTNHWRAQMVLNLLCNDHVHFDDGTCCRTSWPSLQGMAAALTARGRKRCRKLNRYLESLTCLDTINDVK